MKNIKDITISIFAIIGFVAILSSFNNQSEPQVSHGTPESHVWEFQMRQSGTVYIMYNKVTGETRQFDIVNTRDERKAIRTGENAFVYRKAIDVSTDKILVD